MPLVEEITPTEAATALKKEVAPAPEPAKATETDAPSKQPTKKAEDPVLAAIKAGNAIAIKEAGKAALCAVDPETGKPGLYLAANAGHTEVIEALLAMGAKDEPIKAAPGWTAAMVCAFRGQEGALAALLKAGGKEAATCTDAEGKLTPLMLAASRGRAGCCEQLLAVAPETLHAVDTHGRTALMHATSCNDSSALLRMLVERGAKLDEQSRDGKTALIWAIVSHQPHAVEALALLGADPSIRDVDPNDKPIRAGHVPGVGKNAFEHSDNQNTRDPGFRHINKYLSQWEKRRKDDPTAPALPMEDLPWVVHAREFVERSAIEEVEAAKRAAEAPAPTGEEAEAAAADGDDIFGEADIADAAPVEPETRAAPVEREGFIFSRTFQGAKAGMCYKCGEHGIGYYVDLLARPAAEAAAVATAVSDGDLDDLD